MVKHKESYCQVTTKPRAKAASAPQPINTYGFTAPALRSQLDFDRAAFVHKLPFERTGMTRYQLFKRVADVLTPGYFEWQSDWTRRQIDTMVENRWIGMA